MGVKHYKDADGNWFLEIISRSYCSLRDLETEHKKFGRKTWINLYDSCAGLWMMTVQMNLAKAA